MTSKQYRELRNHLQKIACSVNIYGKEYANLNKRIKMINEKIKRRKAYATDNTGGTKKCMNYQATDYNKQALAVINELL